MKIASYNIMSGGFNSYNYVSPFPERLGHLKKAIAKIDADFIGLIDTFRWDSLYSNTNIAKMFSYKKAFCINLEDRRLIEKGHNNGITVLTNLPIGKFEIITIGTRKAVKAELEFTNKKFNIFTIYLDDISEDVRIRQTNSLIKQINPNIPTIVMGDMNTLKSNEIHITNQLIDKFAKANPQLYNAMSPVLDEMKRGEVIQIFEKHGFIDSGYNKGATVPTKLFPAIINGAILRLDYVLHTKSIQIKNFKVLKDPIFEITSDHYPIMFKVEKIK